VYSHLSILIIRIGSLISMLIRLFTTMNNKKNPAQELFFLSPGFIINQNESIFFQHT